MPICLAERKGIVQAAVIQGDAPLLLSRPAMKRLGAERNFHTDELKLLAASVPMSLNSAGQYMIPVSNFEAKESSVRVSKHVCKPEPAHVACDPMPEPSDYAAAPLPPPEVSVVGRKGKSKDYWVVNDARGEVIRKHVRPRSEQFTPCNADCPINPEELSPCRITRWRPANTNDPALLTHDERTDPLMSHAPIADQPNRYWTGETVFSFCRAEPSVPGTCLPDEVLTTQWTRKQSRQLAQQVKRLDELLRSSEHYSVIEVFSPPRFAQQTAVKGQTCLSADLLTGWDFRKFEHRKAMRARIGEEHSTRPFGLLPAMYVVRRWVSSE